MDIVPPDQIRFVASLLVSIPISLLIRKISTVFKRQLYSFIVGTALQFYVFQTEIWIPFLQNIIIYGLVYFKGRKCGFLVTVYSLIVLSLYHLYRMLLQNGVWRLEISIILMSSVCKYSLFAFAYQDFTEKNLTKQQQVNKIKDLPSLFSFLSFCQFAPTAITGTAFQYSHYKSYIQLQAPYDKIKVPLKLILSTLGQCLLYAGIHLIGQIFFPMPYMKTQQFLVKPYWYLVSYSFTSLSLMKFKFYFGFKLSMCPIHASGVSYSQQSKKFDKINTCNPIKVQFALHFRDKVSNWNISCQQWLRKSIYQRVSTNKTKAGLITFLVSAFWHGTYPGYYITFVFWFFIVHLSTMAYKESKRIKSPWVFLYNKSYPLSKGFVWTWNALLLILNGGFFQLLEWQACINYGNALHWIPSIVIFVGILLLSVITGKKDKNKSNNKSYDKDQNVKQKQSQGTNLLKKVQKQIEDLSNDKILSKLQRQRQQKDAQMYKQL